jgi:DNA-directed RNA polymerase II subunit RPB9
MLYPKEDEENHKLQFTCRTCQYTEEATSTCIFKNSMNKAVRETAGEVKDVKVDPTVGKPPSSGFQPSTCASSSEPHVQEPVGDTVDEDEDEDDEIDFDFPDDTIDESSEENLVDSLQTAGYILSRQDLLRYAGESDAVSHDKKNDWPPSDSEKRPICLWD